MNKKEKKVQKALGPLEIAVLERQKNMKICIKCKKLKALTEFYLIRSNKDKLQNYCKDCSNLIHKIHNATPEAKKKRSILNKKLKNNSMYKAKEKASHYKRKYKMDLEQYNQMLKEQNGVCKICGKPEIHLNNWTGKVRPLSVDHCHATGKVRGLLCHTCNLGLGNFKDNSELLRKGAKYLEEL